MWCTVGKESSVSQHLKSGFSEEETNHPLKHHFYPFVLLDQVILQIDMKRLLYSQDSFSHSLGSSFRKYPNGSLCFQGLFQVLPEEDAGVV